MTNKFAVPGKASVLIDGQFGSTGKGLAAAYLAKHNKFDVATTNASANAGHTTVKGKDVYVTYHLPTTAVEQPDCVAFLNAGAIIDPELLKLEIENISKFAPDIHQRLKIHPHAAVIYESHRDTERAADEGTSKTGSTQKGCGAALADKLMRRGNIAANDEYLRQFVDPEFHLAMVLEGGGSVIIEVPQGFGLSLNSGFYPHCTSREVSIGQAFSDAGLHPSYLGKIMMTTRTFPIRVGSITNDFGQVTGYSGDGYPDQQETTFEALGQQPERTTVTKRIRRIFEWSDLQFVHSTVTLKPDYVFLNFVNYLKSADDLEALVERSAEFYNCDNGLGLMVQPFTHYGIGPDVADVFEDRHTVGLEMNKRGLWKG